MSARIDSGLHALVARHLPSRLVVQFVPMGLDDSSVSPEEMRTIATAIGSAVELRRNVSFPISTFTWNDPTAILGD